VSEERELGVRLFNATWELLGSRAYDDRMLHIAHASRFHWGEAPECKPENLARGEWLVSRVYTVLGRAEPAIWHARRCLDHCEENGIGDWDLAYAYEALARASLTTGDRDAAGQYVELAQAVEIADEEDRAHLADDLKTLR
jgi:hypothetical protein